MYAFSFDRLGSKVCCCDVLTCLNDFRVKPTKEKEKQNRSATLSQGKIGLTERKSEDR